MTHSPYLHLTYTASLGATLRRHPEMPVRNMMLDRVVIEGCTGLEEDILSPRNAALSFAAHCHAMLPVALPHSCAVLQEEGKTTVRPIGFLSFGENGWTWVPANPHIPPCFKRGPETIEQLVKAMVEAPPAESVPA